MNKKYKKKVMGLSDQCDYRGKDNATCKTSAGLMSPILGQLPKVLFLALAILLMSINMLKAQAAITGVVYGEDDNLPLPGVTILLKGKTEGSVTDIDGQFKINAMSTDILIFSFIGYVPQEVAVGAQTDFKIYLPQDTKQLNEVVVTALGIEREVKSLGYAVTQVEGSNLSTAKEINVINSLSGKVAGVDIALGSGGPTGSTSVTIRGKAQLSGSNQPLYVIDGVPMDNTQQGSAGQWGGYDMGDGVSSLNSDDIANISVLKGSSATALYGSRGSNGVILITTKKGSQRKGIGVELTSNVTFENVLTKFDDYQTVYGQGRDGLIPTEVDTKNTTQSAWGAKMDPNLMVPIYNGQMKPYGVVDNNILSFFDTGSTLTNTIALSGGNEVANMRVSFSDMRNKDIIPKAGLTRNSFLLNGSMKLNRRLTVTGKVNYVRETADNRPALSDNPNNVGLALIGLAPSFDQKWLSEGYKDIKGNYVNWNGGNIYRINPYWSINEMTNKSERDRIMGYIMTDLEITDWLSLNLRTGTDFYKMRFTNFFPKGSPNWNTGYLQELSTSAREDNFQAMFNINKDFSNSGFSLTSYLGSNLMKYSLETFNNEGRGIILEDVHTIQNFLSASNGYVNPRKQINSLFAAVQLGYKDTYFLDATVRNDWTSTLSAGLNSYDYESLSASFVFANVLPENNIISFGKLRASVAKVGGDTGPYQTSQNYGVKDFSLLGKPLGQLAGTVLNNANLKPTQTYSYEVGTDIRFLQDRIRMDLTYYYQPTNDQIMKLPIPVTSGYGEAWINAGKIVNEGIEIQLGATVLKAGDFSWDMTVNFAKNKNTIPELHPEVKTYPLSYARWAGAVIAAQEGQPYGVIMGKKMLRDPQGNIVHNAAGLPMIDDAAGIQVLGNGQYDFTSGFINSFTYKGISVRALIDYKSGADLFSMSNGIAYSNGTSKHTLEGREEWYASEEARFQAGVTNVADWTPTGGYIGKGVKNTGTADAPVYVTNDIPTNPQSYWGNLYTQSPELFIYDASFVKLREMVISYSIPKKWMGKVFESASISFVGRNLWLIYSSIPNIDPESSYNNGNGQGLEYGSIPTRRSYGFNLNLKF